MDYPLRDEYDELILPPGGEEQSPPPVAAQPANDTTPYELAAESPPPLTAARHPLPPPDPVGMTYGLMPHGPPPLPTDVTQCPSCRVPMPPAAVLCVACGYHRGLRRSIKDDPWAKRSPAVVQAVPQAAAPATGFTASGVPLAPEEPVHGDASLAGDRPANMPDVARDVRWCASCGREIPPGVIHCPRCNLTVSQKLGERGPSVAANNIAELAIPIAAVLATLAFTPAAVAWADGVGGPLLAMVVFVIMINASLGAAVVRLACWLTGEGVPEWPRAAAMCFLAGIVVGGCNLSLRYLPIRGFGGVLGALILMFAAPGMVFFLLLDVTFWKGVLIYAVYFLILLVFFLILGSLLGVAMMAW